MPEIPAQTEILVAGGGPAGLAAAIAARQLGFDVTLVDCANPPIDKACGEGIMPDGLSGLRELGIEIDADNAAPFRGIRFLDDGSQVQASFSHGVGYGIRRPILHNLLVRRASQIGVSLHWGTRVNRVCDDVVSVDGQETRFRWLVCADGHNSRLRRTMGMSGYRCSSKRYGYRRHYNVVPWTDHVEVHWSDCGQMYVTPVGATEVCIAFITRIQNLRFDQALAHFSKLAPRLAEVTWQKDFLGAMTTTARLDSVYRGNVAFVGEASGSVDAITGEGLSLAFRQALALAQALRQNDLRRYQAIHRSSASVPRLMCSLMLAMDRHPALRRRALRAMAADSKAFGHLLSIHTGAAPIKLFDVRHGLSLAWNLMAA